MRACSSPTMSADEGAAGGGQRIDRGINALGGDAALKINERVEVGERVGRGGIGRIVGGNVDGLHGRDGAVLGAGDALLEFAHFGGEGRLVADGAGHSAEQRGHFRAGLGEAENVVDEEQRVGTGFIAEIFSHGEGARGPRGVGRRGFVHLAEDHDGLVDDVLAGVADLGFLHFEPEVGAFAGSFADAGEDGVSAVLLGDAGDEFLNDDGFAQAGPAEQTGLAAAKERREQVDHLDAGFKHLGLGREICKFRRLAVDRPAFWHVDGAAIVDRFAEKIEDSAQSFLPDRHGQGPAGIDDIHSAAQAVGAAQSDSADAAAAQVLLRLRR